MSDVATAEVDVTQFSAALEKYVLMSSKTAVDAINGKMRDLMYMSAKFTPKATRADIIAGIGDMRALAVFRRYLKCGQSPYSPRTYPPPFTSADVVTSMLKLEKPAVGYMRSCFVKAAKQCSKTDASKVAPVEGFVEKNPGTIAEVIKAQLGALASMATCHWNGKDKADADAKQVIVSDAFRKALKYVYEDMRIYFLKKMAAAASEISAR